MTFKQVTGRCEQCADWSRFCTGKTAAWFKSECPLTCGVCSPSSRAIERAPLSSVSGGLEPPDATEKPPNTCRDDKCVAAWKAGDKCPTCSEMGNSFCSEEVFASACRQTCNLCADGGVESVCKDVFSSFTCGRYKAYGWCTRSDMQGPVSRQCPLTCGLCSPGSNGTAQGAEAQGAKEGDGESEDGEEGGKITTKAGKHKAVYGWPPPRGSSDLFSTSAPQRGLAATVLLLLLGLRLAA